MVLTLCGACSNRGMTSVSSRCATSAITLSRQALIIRWWPIAAVPRRKLTELSRRAAALDRAIAEHERQHGAFDLVFSNLHKTDRIVSRSKRLTADRLWFCIHGILSTSYLGHRKGWIAG